MSDFLANKTFSQYNICSVYCNIKIETRFWVFHGFLFQYINNENFHVEILSNEGILLKIFTYTLTVTAFYIYNIQFHTIYDI